MRVAVVSEYYPRAADPVLGVWAHRQALAARDAGAEVEVLVLHRPIPPLAALKAGPIAAARAAVRAVAQPRRAVLDGLRVTYVPFVSPPRPSSYGSWGAWAAPPLRLALRALRRRFAYDLVHAHNAVPAGEAARRSAPGTPLVVSVHGSDVFHTAPRFPGAGEAAVRAAFGAARLVLANSAGTEERARALGARATRVVRLGTDLPPAGGPREARPTIVTTGHLVARKRHADVVRALADLPGVRYLVIGDGPEREPLLRLAADLGLADRVEVAGQLPHAEALARTRRAHAFVMPSVDEAFGVAYVEAMAGGLPAIGIGGEPGPEEIAGAGDGLLLAPREDPAALATAIRRALDDDALGASARATAERCFSWEACGRATVAAYEEALR